RGRLRPTNTHLRIANALLRDPRPACRREAGRSRTRGSVRWLGEPVLDLGEQLLRGALRGTGGGDRGAGQVGQLRVAETVHRPGRLVLGEQPGPEQQRVVRTEGDLRPGSV